MLPMKTIRVVTHRMFCSLILLLALLLGFNKASAQVDTPSNNATDSIQYPTYIIRGLVYDSITGDPIPYATVVLTSATDTTGVATDVNGFYQIKIKRDFADNLSKVQLRCNYIGYFESAFTNLEFSGNMATVKIQLAEDPTPIEPIVEPARKVSVVQLDPKMIKRIPKIGPVYGPPRRYIEITFDADYYRTEAVNLNDDDF